MGLGSSRRKTAGPQVQTHLRVPPRPSRPKDVKGTATFFHGATLFKALRWWLGELRWLPESNATAASGISYTELAIDFEVATGLNLPPDQHHWEAAGFKDEATSKNSIFQ